MRARGITRRGFLYGGAGAGAALVCGQAFADEASDGLAELGRAVGWDPNAPESFYFLQATDLHASEITSGALKMPDKFGGRNFADDMSALRPKPAFVALTGDLIAATTRNPATWPQAEAGFRRVRDLIVSRLTVPCHMIIGNNDCSPEAYHTVWPERPVYWSFDRQGVHFVGLHGYNAWKPENSNHAGIVLDDAQLAWLKRDLAAAATARTLVIFTHEPLKDPDCHLIRKQLAPLLDKVAGKIWNIAGHNHGNADNRVRIGGREVRVLETTTPVGAWTPDKGAYRLVFVSDGRVVGSGLRWLTKDGEPLRFEADRADRKVPLATTVEEALGKEAVRLFLVGGDEVPLRVAAENVTDRVSNLQFKKGAALTYKIPREGWGGQARRLMLAIRQANVAVALSDDGRAWRQAPALEAASGFAAYGLPEQVLSSGDLSVRITAPEGQGGLFYGFAFLR